METPSPHVAISRHEEHYACGCTTTRIERILLPAPDPRHCSGHGGALIKIVHTTEFESDPVQEAGKLRLTG